MRILLSYYSRTGYTEKLANIIKEELGSRGHKIEVEVIKPTDIASNKWALAAPCLPGAPSMLVSSFLFRLRRYSQYDGVSIEPLEHPDVSQFDRVVIGGTKWGHLSYPVARYLKEVKGLDGTKVGGFATFAGPPLEGFEMYSYFFPFNDLVRAAGGEVVAQLGLSSGYHELHLMPVFRVISHLRFHCSVSQFGIESEWGKQKTSHFCDLLEKEHTLPEDLEIP